MPTLRSALLCLFLPASIAWSQGHLRTERPRCELLTNPLSIHEPNPQLSWELTAERRAEHQTAYRVLVASSPEALARDEADLWDSGRVESDRTAHIPYQGKPLPSRAACWWKVMAWDRDANPGPWSQPAHWEMGLLHPHDWSAQWIEAAPIPAPFVLHSAVYGQGDLPQPGHGAADVTDRVASLLAQGPFPVNNNTLGPDPVFGQRKRLVAWGTLDNRPVRIEEPEGSTARAPRGTIPLLRKPFTVRPGVTRARLHATALGVYELSLNGRKVGDQSLAPGWTDYRKRLRYQTYDLTDQLTPGPHALGAVVAPGWFSGHAGLFGAFEYYGTTPALLLQLEITYADGTTDRVTSDDSWKQHPGPWTWADLFDGENYDARAAVPGWDTPALDDRDWQPVTTRTEQRHLEPDICQPVRELARLPAVVLTEPAPGRWTFDLGQNMVGVAHLRLNAPAGTIVTIRHGEMLNPDGTIYTGNLRAAPSTDVYICRGEADEWRPRFTFHGFRYVELIGLTERPDLSAVTGIALGTDTPIVGDFACSDPRINQLQSNIVWGMRGNYLSVPTDCPQRDERMGWTADAQVFLPTALMNADAAPFMAKWTTDLIDAQRDDGAHSDVAPATFGLTYGSPAWADAGTVVPWAVYQATGDTRVLERAIDSMKAWVDWCHAHSTDLIRDRDRGNDYGDWLSIDADTPKDLIGTAYFAHAADTVARSLTALARHDEAQAYAALAADIRAAFRARYVTPDGRVQGNTQTAYAIALRFGLLDGSEQAAAIEHLAAGIEARGWRLSTGFVGVSHLLHALDDAGRPDIAARLLLQDAFPSWLFSVKHGATTIWERWNGWTPETGPHPDVTMNSFNHYSLGSCGRWLYEGVAGLRPAAPGWQHAVIKPTATHAFSHAQASHQSIRGNFSVAWQRTPATFTLTTHIPPNTTATVWLPTRPNAAITESDTPAADAEGITTITPVDHWTRLEVASGTYHFTVK